MTLTERCPAQRFAGLSPGARSSWCLVQRSACPKHTVPARCLEPLPGASGRHPSSAVGVAEKSFSGAVPFCVTVLHWEHQPADPERRALGTIDLSPCTRNPEAGAAWADDTLGGDCMLPPVFANCHSCRVPRCSVTLLARQKFCRALGYRHPWHVMQLRIFGVVLDTLAWVQPTARVDTRVCLCLCVYVCVRVCVGVCARHTTFAQHSCFAGCLLTCCGGVGCHIIDYNRPAQRTIAGGPACRTNFPEHSRAQPCVRNVFVRA